MAEDAVVEDLQIRLAFQEDTLQALDRTVARQQQHIEALEAELNRLKELVRELTPPEAGPVGEEPPPPHY